MAGPAGPGQPRRVAVPGQPSAGVPGRRDVRDVAGERRMAARGQRPAEASGPRDVTGERRVRSGAAKPRPPALALVPPPRTIPDECPEVEVPAPGTGPGSAERARRPVRQAAARPARPPRARTRPRTRLTRRGRIVVSVLVLALMLLLVARAWIAGGAARAEAAGNGGPPPSAVYRNLRSVTVEPGESLWTIATQAEPNADPRGVIQEIIDLNALSGTSVQPGRAPVGAARLIARHAGAANPARRCSAARPQRRPADDPDAQGPRNRRGRRHRSGEDNCLGLGARP